MRKPTGIKGLDPLIEGGLNENTSTLVTGKTGTGKTTFVLQFLYEGAKKYSESGILITTEETPASLRKHGEQFGWDIAELEKNNMLRLLEVEPFGIDVLIPTIEADIEKIGAKRIVIDPVSMFELYIEKKLETRKVLFKVLKRLKEMGCTVLITSEIPEESSGLSRFGIIEFITDAVIVLQYMSLAKYKRSLMIRKMRDTNHSTDIHPFEIGPKGLIVHGV